MTDTFTDRVQQAIADGDPAATATALAGATPQQRRAVAQALRQVVKASNGWEVTNVGSGTQMYTRAYDEATLMVAGAACMPTAAQVAAWLCRRGFSFASPPPDLIVDALRERPVTWLAEVAKRVAEAPNRDNRIGRWQLAAALLVAADLPAPATDDAVLGWLADRFGYVARERGGIRVALRQDPFLDQFIGRLFEVDGAGALFEIFSYERDRPGFTAADVGVQALAGLAEEGRLARGTLLDGCLSRFLKGERPHSLRAFVELHQALTPTLDELAARSEDYARLLPDTYSTVATLAQAALRRLDDAGMLDRQTLLQAGRDVLFRAEKGLLRTQLGWLDRAARRDPDHAGEVAEVIAVAFAHPALDIQERALTVAAQHIEHCDPTVRTVLADAAARLGADLPARAAALFGPPASVTATPLTTRPGPSAAPAPPRPMPPPIDSPAEVAAELTGLLTNTPEPVAWERALDALVRLSATDRPGLRASLAPLLDRFELNQDRAGPDTVSLPVLLGRVLTVVASTQTGSVWRAFADTVHHLFSHPVPVAQRAVRGVPAPHLMMIWRLNEIGRLLDGEPVPYLLATPTAVTGHIDPHTLIERITTAQRQGWQPWPVDLAQALLRLPRSARPDVVDAARTLTSPAGLALADWLATGGPPDPVAEVDSIARSRRWYDTELASYPVVRLSARTPAQHPILEGMLRYEPAEYDHWKLTNSQPLWPAALPSHREVVAAHVLPEITMGLLYGRTRLDAVLPALADCTGPCGPATWLLIASALGSPHDDDRVAGVDAVLALDTAGDLDGHALGWAIWHLVNGRDVKLTRVTPALIDLAAAVAGPAAWHTVTTLLAAVLPEAKPPAGTADVLALAATLAASNSLDTPITGLTETAARTGTSRLATEARRLNRILSG